MKYCTVVIYRKIHKAEIMLLESVLVIKCHKEKELPEGRESLFELVAPERSEVAVPGEA